MFHHKYSDCEQCSRCSTDRVCLPLTVFQCAVFQDGGKGKDRYLDRINTPVRL